jgi:hypothetical protein
MTREITPITVTLEYEREVYRCMALAALDDLADAQQTIDKLREQIREMREERRRMAVAYFGEPSAA